MDREATVERLVDHHRRLAVAETIRPGQDLEDSVARRPATLSPSARRSPPRPSITWTSP